jgi:uncharacterized membrane protein
MSTPYPYPSTSAQPAVPATKEFTAAWIAYVAYAAAALPMTMFVPAIVGLIINYSKRGHPETGFIDSHHRWMLRSFWWTQLAFTVFFVLILVGMWPILSDIVSQAIRSGDWQDTNVDIHINWRAIFTSAGAAMFGGLGLVATWCWYVYRYVRGMIVLADARPMP